MASDRFSKTVNIRNKQASFGYELLDSYVAGFMLKGTEIKSVREGKVNLTDGHVFFHRDEAFVKGISISPFAQGTRSKRCSTTAYGSNSQATRTRWPRASARA